MKVAKLHMLHPFFGEKKRKKRVGRGEGSGLGGTSGRGHKGQNARSGGGVPPWFEGGQMPLVRRVPKRGFRNPFRQEYNIINLDQLEKKFKDKQEITLDDLYSICKRKKLPLKILSRGEISRPIKIQAHKFSKQAKEKIIQAGGEVIELEVKEDDSSSK